MAFQEFKQRQSVVWGSAPFERVAEQIAEIHDALVAELRRSRARSGSTWVPVPAVSRSALRVRALT
jgi:hypothetical protein